MYSFVASISMGDGVFQQPKNTDFLAGLGAKPLTLVGLTPCSTNSTTTEDHSNRKTRAGSKTCVFSHVFSLSTRCSKKPVWGHCKG